MDIKEILGIIAALAFIAFSALLLVPLPQPLVSVSAAQSFSQALWESRSLDVFLQVLIILAGTFSILTLVKERNKR